MLLTRVGLLHTNYTPTARWGLSSGAEHIENEPLVQMSSTSAVVAILRNGDQQAPTISLIHAMRTVICREPRANCARLSLDCGLARRSDLTT